MQQKKTTNDRQKQGDAVFALDIGTRTVVGVYGDQQEETFILRDYFVAPHTKRAMIDGQIEDIRQVAKIVSIVKQEIEERNNVTLDRVSVAAAGRALKTIHLSMDFDVSNRDVITDDMIKSMEIETVQKAQAEIDEKYKESSTTFYCVGHSVIRYSLDDYDFISLEGHKGDKATVELIATFLPDVVVEGLNSVMDMNNLEVDSLTLEPIAAMNLIIPREIRLINIALVDIGAGTSDIAISKDGSIVAYAMATIAGDEITEEIIREFFVDFNTAEQMKHDSTTDKAEITYRDIFSFEQTVKTKDFYKKLDKSITNLADTICENIIEVNGGSPAAVFLVGGGSLINGLTDKVAKKMKIDPNRVVVGRTENFRSVDMGNNQLGAEFATPLGIAVTSIFNRGYDFSVIELNDRKLRIFDTKQITLFDLLTMAGYKSHEIMGRSGRNLTFTLGGRHRTIKGEQLTPSEVAINGELASLNSKVQQGDKIDFKPAVCGANAHATLGEVYDFSENENGKVTFAGDIYPIGAQFAVRGEIVGKDYEIQSLDRIETVGVLTLGDLLRSLNVQVEGESFTVNGEVESESYILQDSDIIDYEAALLEGGSKPSVPEPPPIIPTEPEEPIDETLCGEITVRLNGKDIQLPPTTDRTPHLFLEMLTYIDYDTEKPATNYTMTLNGRNVAFTDVIKDGDDIFIELI